MTRLTILIMAVLVTHVFLGLPGAVAESEQKTNAVIAEDYALYDQVLMDKFLTAKTQLIVIERMTRFRLSPDQEGATTTDAFQEQEYFDGELPTELVRESILVNRLPSRFEGRFHVGTGAEFLGGVASKELDIVRYGSHVDHSGPGSARSGLTNMSGIRKA